MSRSIKVKAINHGNVVVFRVAETHGILVEELPKISVSLSREPGGCVFSLDKLENHDHHAPYFYTGEDAVDLEKNPYHKYGGQTALNNYKDRVLKCIGLAIQNDLPGVEYITETENVDESSDPEESNDGSNLDDDASIDML